MHKKEREIILSPFFMKKNVRTHYLQYLQILVLLHRLQVMP